MTFGTTLVGRHYDNNKLLHCVLWVVLEL
jgi:hypothetical protein